MKLFHMEKRVRELETDSESHGEPHMKLCIFAGVTGSVLKPSCVQRPIELLKPLRYTGDDRISPLLKHENSS